MAGRASALSLPVGSRSRAQFRSYARRTPVFTFSTGGVLVSLTLPERVSAAHVEFARCLAEQAAAYAVEVERLYRNGASGKAVA
ncbi:hypothetical protein [Actinoallomurus rhizosphaericola]|uniref:hypothetical protein n=1 Tax=Actinoallomurus rhizosphaericola TaxID=2952536 RepID=UPI002091A582|nr:hypothetical protein [Actinoallomurus rhizosphaericola]MCO5993013.1 hypothetical protein [Actinoallomurus rhizosphaericola]